MPKFSVIIPVYNAENYLRECLDSIVNQTLTDIEIICVDDGSSDGSSDIIKEYVSRDERIKFISQDNLSAGVARNNGLKIATGEYVHFLDADDLLYDNKVYENIYNSLKENPNCNILRCKAKAFDNKTKAYCKNILYERLNIPKDKSILNTNEDINYILKLSVTPWIGFIKRDFVLEHNFAFNNLRCCNDHSFFIESMLNADKIYLSDLFIVKHHINDSSSLIGVRDKFFDCHYKSINIIYEILKKYDVPEIIKLKILAFGINDLLYWFQLFFYNSKYSYEIYKSTIEFLREFNVEPYLFAVSKKELCIHLSDLAKSNKTSQFNYFYERYINNTINKKDKKPVFYIENKDIYKVINILGLDFKIKDKELEYQLRIKILEKKVEKLKKKLKEKERNNCAPS